MRKHLKQSTICNQNRYAYMFIIRSNICPLSKPLDTARLAREAESLLFRVLYLSPLPLGKMADKMARPNAVVFRLMHVLRMYIYAHLCRIRLSQ